MRPADPSSLAALFAAHGAALVLYARAVLPADDRPAAEDVVQEVFASLLERAGSGRRLDVPPAPAAWLHRCVRNACLDTRRSAFRRRRWERAAAADRADWFDPRPGDLVDAADAQRALAGLPDDLRQVVVLRLWSGLTLAEVGEVTGAPVSTVHDQYRKAIGLLRRAMGGATQVPASRAGTAASRAGKKGNDDA
ncbi:MAG TPA: sigma-70 family RNA polymerase sigma factor [Humisphaera sp.]